MKLYQELAEWWPLLSAPEEYAEEARLYWEIISRYKRDIQTALELGSGGGNNAFHLKKYCRWTLTDLSPQMLEVSRKLNPECQHVVSDMRSLELREQFDLVFIHDAISYLTSEKDLSQVFQVAFSHLKPGGLLFVTPDFFTETFRPSTNCGGYDQDGKGLRYLEWSYDSDPHDQRVEVEYAYIFRDASGRVQSLHESTINGLFPQDTWKQLMQGVGFKVSIEPVPHSQFEPGTYFALVGKKRLATF